MESGILAEWLVEDGADVTAGQEIYALENEKSTQEVESPASGKLKIIIQADGEEYPVGELIGSTAKERAEVRMWTRRIDLEIAVPMTLGFRGGAGRPMFEPRIDVVGPDGAADLSRMSDNRWKWLDGQLAGKDYICQNKFTMADLIAYCYIQFGYTVGWSLPEGTDNLAKFVDRIGQRPSSKVWQDSE